MRIKYAATVLGAVFMTGLLLLMGCQPSQEQEMAEFISNLDKEASGIIPGIMDIGNVDVGMRIEAYVIIKNGQPEPWLYEVYYRPPDNVTNGFVGPSPDVADWVYVGLTRQQVVELNMTGIVDPTLLRNILVECDPYSLKRVPVTIIIPDDAYLPDHMEFWIGMHDANEGGFIRTEMNTRFRLTKRAIDWTPVWLGALITLVVALMLVFYFEHRMKRNPKYMPDNSINGG